MKSIRTISLICAVFCLGACATGGSRTVDGSEVKDVLASFKSGELRLDCELACSVAWGSSRRDAKSLYENQLWTDLALKVANVGFRTDLAYYYLGRSAEGLGYIDAAKTYFALAQANRYKCYGNINTCDGIDVPNSTRTALERLSNTAIIPKVASGSVEANTTGVPVPKADLPLSSLANTAEVKNESGGKAGDAKQGKDQIEASLGDEGKRKEATRLAEEARLRKEREELARKEEAKRQMAERQAEEARQRQEREETKRREEVMRQESVRQAEEARKEAKRQEENNEKLARNSIRKATVQERSQIIKAVNQTLFDEDSARYKEIYLIPNSYACVEVNGKNRFGGYTGYQEMVVAYINRNWISIKSLHDNPITCLDLIAKLSAK